ncbi:MAG TPA: hypothetical protein ENJ95_10130 [Bacteroidetes bacterium]|nr:hypothetical protein [Bacteroidota bacterium]
MTSRTQFIKTFPLVFSFFLLANNFALSQNHDFSEVDEYAVNFKGKYESPAALAVKLTEPFDSELEKSRAIFMWIAQNIRYDCKKFHKPKSNYVSAASKEELEAKIAAGKAKATEKAFKIKKGVCEDYSQIFKTMCGAAGLEAVVVTGNARDFHKPHRNAHNNPHAWNAVKIDGQWHLLDATWAAGYTDPAVKKFTRKLSTGFFMTDPAWLIQNHFPDDPKWQLLDEPISKKEFPDQPMVNFGQQDYPVLGFSEKIKKVKGKGYDRELRIKLERSPKYFFLTTQRGRAIKFKHVSEDGYEVFRFAGRNVRNIVLFGGEDQQRMGWLAKYEL